MYDNKSHINRKPSVDMLTRIILVLFDCFDSMLCKGRKLINEMNQV